MKRKPFDPKPVVSILTISAVDTMVMVEPKLFEKSRKKKPLHESLGKVLFSMDDIRKYAEKRDARLTADKFNHDSVLSVNHSDGTSFIFSNYLVESTRFKFNKTDEVVWLVFTEHHGHFVFMASDLEPDYTLFKVTDTFRIGLKKYFVIAGEIVNDGTVCNGMKYITVGGKELKFHINYLDGSDKDGNRVSWLALTVPCKDDEECNFLYDNLKLKGKEIKLVS